ncbi:hypothetical protein GH5_03941 [Leishmania sp. Ghana 2012 LV757]|uniref:Uncharacterized protein n=1 Tax=Leishmania orientalis TaxID=2249476 RepID=A0A836GJ27_9TRYP|nr:hypothetical protein LSCM4_03817 [Leishmania orientalis]KAG5499806.1 hypothetical protein GH5_03941 [Leishmania sp. Ghana 2012 LV757]
MSGVMRYSQSACAAPQGKSDTFVTSLDVFSRASYIDPYRTHVGVDVLPATATLTQAQLEQAPMDAGSPSACKSEGGAENCVAFDESAVSKLKRFSSLSAFTAANSVIDYLQENLGGVVLPDDGVGRDVLLQRRRSFFDSLFTIEEDLRTAFPCRFSTSDVDNLFRSTSEEDVSSTESYRRRLAALQKLRSTLGC